MWHGVTLWQQRWRRGCQYGLGLVLYITGMAVAVRLLIRMLPLPTMMALLDTKAVARPPSSLAPGALVQLTQRLLHLSRPRLRPNCMTQSLTAFYFLRKWGHPVRIHFGIAKRDNTLAGHCWLELHETPLAEPNDPRHDFTTVVTFPQVLVTTKASS